MGVPISSSKVGVFNTFNTQHSSWTAIRLSDGALAGPVNVTKTGCPEQAQVKSATSKGAFVSIGNSGVKWRTPTTYSRRCHRWTYMSGTAQYVISGWTYYYTGVHLDSNPGQDNPEWVSWHFGILNHDGREEAKAKAMSKLNDQKVQLGTFLAETQKTARMLADDVYKVARFLIDAKKRPWRLPRHLRPLKRPDGLWLKWRYGYRPLISDLTSIAEQLQEQAYSMPLILTARSTVNTRRSGPYTRQGRTGSYNTTLRDTCAVWATLADDFKHRLHSIGLDDPLSVGWELVPFSFVVDWFSPIGKVLQAYSAPAGLNFLAGFTSQARFGTIKMPEYCGTSEQKYHIFLREKVTNWPKPRVYFVNDPFSLGGDKPFNWQRALDAISLLLR